MTDDVMHGARIGFFMGLLFAPVALAVGCMWIGDHDGVTRFVYISAGVSWALLITPYLRRASGSRPSAAKGVTS